MNYDGPFVLDRSQIEQVEFLPPTRVQRMIDDGARQFTPTFLRVFRYYASKVL
jgi:hypothetical protein